MKIFYTAAFIIQIVGNLNSVCTRKFRLFLFLLALLSVSVTHAQTRTQFNGDFNITYLNALGNRTFTIKGTFNNANNEYTANQVQNGDRIIDKQGNTFEITSQSVVGLEITTTSKAFNDNNPILGGAIIYRPTSNGFPLVTTNAPATSKTSAMNTATIEIDESLPVYTSGNTFPINPAPKYGDVFYNGLEDKLYMMDDNSQWVSISSTEMPRGSTAERPLTGNPGDFYYDTDQNILFFSDTNNSWVEVSVNGSTPAGNSLPLNGVRGQLFFNTTDKKLYVYDGGGWIPTDNALPNGKIFVGNTSGVAKAVSMYGDATMDNSGALTITNGSITNAKLSKSNIPLSGFAAAADNIDMGGNLITNLQNPSAAQDAATRGWVETVLGSPSSYLSLPTGQFFLGVSNKATATAKSSIPISGFGKAIADVAMGDGTTQNKITNLKDPGNPQDAATKNYIDTKITATDHVSLTDTYFMVGTTGNVGSGVAKSSIPISGFGKAIADVAMGDGTTQNKITNLKDPGNPQDAATKNYIDTKITATDHVSLTDTYFMVGTTGNVGSGVAKSSIPISGFDKAIADVAMGDGTTQNKITYLKDPSDPQDAATKNYVDKSFADPSSSLFLPNGQFFIGSLSNKATAIAKGSIPISGFGKAVADIAMGDGSIQNKITYVKDPDNPQDAATKNYVDTHIANPAYITLPSGYVLVGNADNQAAEVTMSGDATITNAGVLTIANDAVTTAKILDGSVTNAKLDKANIPLSGFGAAGADVSMGDGTTQNKITYLKDPSNPQDAATKSYVDTKISNPGSMTLNDTKILVGNAGNRAAEVTMSGDATITNAGVLTIANDAVTTAKILDGNVTNAKLDKVNIPLSGFGAAGADVAMGDGTTQNKITYLKDPSNPQDAATKSYVDTKISNPGSMTLNDNKILVGNAGNQAAEVTMSGDATITNAGVLTIANDAVTMAKILDGNVTNAKLDKVNIPLSGFGAAVTDVAMGDGTTQNKITYLKDPGNPQDAATKNYIDTKITATDHVSLTDTYFMVGTTGNVGSGVAKSSISLSGFGAAGADVSMGDGTMNYKITNLSDPGSPQDAATKSYVDTKISNPGSMTLNDTKILVGNAGNQAAEVTISGDATITNAGVLTIANDAVTTAKILDGSVSNAKLDKANIPLSGFSKAITDIAMGDGTMNYKITNLSDPGSPQDAATKSYVDNAIAASVSNYGPGTVMTIADVQSVTGKKTFDNATWAMKGTGTGVTTLVSANNTGTNYILTLPGKSGILATTDVVTSSVDGLMLATDKIKLDAFTSVTSSAADAGKVLALNNTGTGTVWVTAATDNMGDHTAIKNLKMNGFRISNDGATNKGLSFADDGKASFEQDLTVKGNFYTPSDERLKTKIETLTNVLEKIDRMRGVRFEFKDQKKYAAGSKIGVLAQELQKVYPELVTVGTDGFLKVDYTQLTAVLIQAVKEQQQQINELKAEMANLQEQINEIRKNIR